MNLGTFTGVKETPLSDGKITIPVGFIEVGFQGLESLTNETITTYLQTGKNGKIDGFQEMNLKSAIYAFLKEGGAVVQHEFGGKHYAKIPINQLGGFEILDGETLIVQLKGLTEANSYELNAIEEFVEDGYSRHFLKNDTAVMNPSDVKRPFVVKGYSTVVIRGIDNVDTIELVNLDGKRKERPVAELKREAATSDEIVQISKVKADANDVLLGVTVTQLTHQMPNALKIDLSDISELIIKKVDTANAVYLDYVKAFED
jgi:hypothetical protein